MKRQALKPGDPVVVIGGLSRGQRGVIAPTPERYRAFGWSTTIPHLAVELPEGTRIIRADFVARAEVPS